MYSTTEFVKKNSRLLKDIGWSYTLVVYKPTCILYFHHFQESLQFEHFLSFFTWSVLGPSRTFLRVHHHHRNHYQLGHRDSVKMCYRHDLMSPRQLQLGSGPLLPPKFSLFILQDSETNNLEWYGLQIAENTNNPVYNNELPRSLLQGFASYSGWALSS